MRGFEHVSSAGMSHIRPDRLQIGTLFVSACGTLMTVLCVRATWQVAVCKSTPGRVHAGPKTQLPPTNSPEVTRKAVSHWSWKRLDNSSSKRAHQIMCPVSCMSVTAHTSRITTS